MSAPGETSAAIQYPPQPEQQVNGINHSNGTEVPPQSANGVGDGSTTTTAPGLSADDMALYDRQIRLWGAKAQQQIQSAKVLLISLRALGTEIAKNLTLAGISQLTIVDNDPVTEEDLGSGFFLREEDINKPRGEAAVPRIQELNPRVKVTADGGLQELLIKDPMYYAQFECIIACDHDFMTLSMINTAARFASRPFYAAGIHGFYGYIFTDLVAHEFVIEREKSNKPTAVTAETLTRAVLGVTERKENNGKTTEIVKKCEIYCPFILANSSPLPLDVLNNRRKLKNVPPLLPCLRALFEFERELMHLPAATPQDLQRFAQLAKQKTAEMGLPAETLSGDFLRSFLQNVGAEITPTAAFVGGRLSEDVINVLGKREQPIQNFALFDGDSLDGKIYCLYTIPPEMAMGAMGFDPNLPMPTVDMSGNMTGDLTGLNGMAGDMSDLNGMSMGMGMNGMSLMQMPPMDMNTNMSASMPSNPTQEGAPQTTAEANANGNGETQQQTSQPQSS
ncbi:DNA damage tolerance protein RHC31 [Pseudocercospora fuligena]|uniref:Ubiquitin-like 1-activating enzyme E1A n=1 Tax=Pseudocercospora fuligena TaxID=685502 RepID=A0A8H6RIL1_9PEZI|nr:DNA damage tolerance protein RHC31 [Pseudocercospora fuligena]